MEQAKLRKRENRAKSRKPRYYWEDITKTSVETPHRSMAKDRLAISHHGDRKGAERTEEEKKYETQGVRIFFVFLVRDLA